MGTEMMIYAVYNEQAGQEVAESSEKTSGSPETTLSII